MVLVCQNGMISIRSETKPRKLTVEGLPTARSSTPRLLEVLSSRHLDRPGAGSEPLGKDAGLPEDQIWGAKSEQQSRVHVKDSRPLVLRRGHESLHYSAWAGPCFAPQRPWRATAVL